MVYQRLLVHALYPVQAESYQSQLQPKTEEAAKLAAELAAHDKVGVLRIILVPTVCDGSL